MLALTELICIRKFARKKIGDYMPTIFALTAIVEKKNKVAPGKGNKGITKIPDAVVILVAPTAVQQQEEDSDSLNVARNSAVKETVPGDSVKQLKIKVAT